jgi:hypothetical protein
MVFPRRHRGRRFAVPPDFNGGAGLTDKLPTTRVDNFGCRSGEPWPIRSSDRWVNLNHKIFPLSPTSVPPPRSTRS